MAPLPLVLQNMKKWLGFHKYRPKGLLNFRCLALKHHTLNYSTTHLTCLLALCREAQGFLDSGEADEMMIANSNLCAP